MILTNVQKQIIEQKCKPFIRELGDYENRLIYSVLPDRYTDTIDTVTDYQYSGKHIPAYLQDAFNSIFKKYFNYQYCEGMHCYSKTQGHSSYDNQYAIFPVGEFSYCWAPSIVGIFEHYVSHTSTNRIDYEFDYDEVMEYVDHEVRNKYVNNRIIDAIDNSNEILILCKTYLVIPVNSSQIRVTNETITGTSPNIRR